MSEYERLAELVREARVRRYRTVDKARAVAGISRGAWDNVEHGKPAKPLTYTGVELALGWEYGSCLRILAGGEPSAPGRTAEDLRRRYPSLSEDDVEHLAVDAGLDGEATARLLRTLREA
jgi:hypothetical protein